MSFPLFLEDWWKDKSKTIPMGMPCKVVSFNQAQKTCDVQPLFRREVDGIPRDYPILSKVPVIDLKISDSFSIPIQYNKDDLVWVSFCVFDISRALTKQPVLESERTMGLENCVVIGKIGGNGFSLPGGSFGADGSKVVLKNNDANFYTLFLALLTALKSLGTTGGPTSQSVDVTTIAAIQSVEELFEKLFSQGTQ